MLSASSLQVEAVFSLGSSFGVDSPCMDLYRCLCRQVALAVR